MGDKAKSCLTLTLFFFLNQQFITEKEKEKEKEKTN